jgi:membrane protein
VGGGVVAVGIAAAKKLLTVYLGLVPTYSAVYGAFATLPILLVWIYLAWIIVLMGAVITAYLPSLLAGVSRRGGAHGWQFQLALETLQSLEHGRNSTPRGMPASALAQQLRVDALALEPVLDTLMQLDWVGQLVDTDSDKASNFVLLVNPDSTTIEPLVDALLLDRTLATDKLRARAGWAETRLREVL